VPVDDRELFPRDLLPRLAAVKLSEIAEAAGCSKASGPEHQAREVDAVRLDVGRADDPLHLTSSTSREIFGVLVQRDGPLERC
jgi:hypothetical protein